MLCAQSGEGVERLEVVAAPLRVPITLQLKEPRVPLPPAAFFQRYHTWHYSASVSGAPPPCAWIPRSVRISLTI
jgi:hypothetical protein